MRKLTVLLLVLLVFVMVTPSVAEPPIETANDTMRLKVFIHYPREAKGKPPPKPAPCEPTQNDQVQDFAKAGWRLEGTVEYHVNYNSIPGTVQNPQTAIANSFQTWDNQTGAVHFAEGSPTGIFAQNDGVHVVAWGRVSAGRAIAVTYVWYYPSTGQLVDVDTIMNVRLPWSYTEPSGLNPDQVCGDPYSYDVQNILTHEVGHWMGLDDLYAEVDQDLTMYGYGDKGELKKDTLGLGDQLGIGAIYK